MTNYCRMFRIIFWHDFTADWPSEKRKIPQVPIFRMRKGRCVFDRERKWYSFSNLSRPSFVVDQPTPFVHRRLRWWEAWELKATGNVHHDEVQHRMVWQGRDQGQQWAVLTSVSSNSFATLDEPKFYSWPIDANVALSVKKGLSSYLLTTMPDPTNEEGPKGPSIGVGPGTYWALRLSPFMCLALGSSFSRTRTF